MSAAAVSVSVHSTQASTSSPGAGPSSASPLTTTRTHSSTTTASTDRSTSASSNLNLKTLGRLRASFVTLRSGGKGKSKEQDSGKMSEGMSDISTAAIAAEQVRIKSKEKDKDTWSSTIENGQMDHASVSAQKDRDKDKETKDRGRLYSARMGLSKVGLRRLSSREQTNVATSTAAHRDTSRAAIDIGVDTPTSETKEDTVKAPAGKERGRSSREMDRDKDRTVKVASPPASPTSHPPSSFVNLPQASASSPTLHSSSARFTSSTRHGAGRVETVVEEEKERGGSRRGNGERERDKEKEKNREKKASISGPSPLGSRRDRERTRERERPARPPTPPSPTPPPRSPSSNSTSIRGKLTSPSSPSLLSSSSSPSSPATSRSTRPRPSPLQPTSPISSSTSGSGSIYASANSPTTPTSPVRARAVSPSSSPPQAARITSSSPTPTKPRQQSISSSRPPLSPSASANASGRLRLRLVTGSISSANLPLDGSMSSLSASTTTASSEAGVGMEGSGSTSSSAGRRRATGSAAGRGGDISGRSSVESVRGREREAERTGTERRRSSLDSSRPGTGRTTPTQSNAYADSSMSRAARRDRESTQSRRPHYGIGSASMTSLPLQTSATPHIPSRTESPTLTRNRGSSQRRNVSSPSPTRSRSPGGGSSPSTSRLLQTPRVASGSHAQTKANAVSTLPPEYRDTLRHAASLLLRELQDPRLRPSASQLRAQSPTLPQSISRSGGRTTPPLSPEVWDECDRRLSALARSERMWAKSTGPYKAGAVAAGQSTVSLVNPSMVSLNSLSGKQMNEAGSVSGATGSGFAGGGSEERERKLFAEAVRDGYVLCQLINKLRPDTIARIDPREDGFRRTSNITHFLAAAKGRIGVSDRELFHRDDLLECTPEALFRVARTIIAIVRVAGDEGTLLERMESKTMRGSGLAASQNMSAKKLDDDDDVPHPNSPYGTARSKGASVSTPNLSTMQWLGMPSSPNKKRWNPTSPSLPTVRSDSPDEEQGKASSTTSPTNQRRPAVVHSQNRMDESAIASDSDEDDEAFFDASTSPEPRSPSTPQMGKRTLATVGLPIHESPGRVSIASGTTQTTNTTAGSSLLASRVPMSSERSSNAFNTIRTVATVATTVPPEPPEVLARKRSTDGYGAKPLLSSQERRPSETAVIDLSRVIEESEDGAGPTNSAELTRTKSRPQPIQLKKGKWPEDFMDLMNPPSPARPVAIRRTGTSDEISPLPSSSPRRISPLSAAVQNHHSNGSTESLSQLVPRRPSTRPRHSLDAPSGLTRELTYGREASPGPDGLTSTSRLIPRRTSTKINSANRNGMYVPRSGSASPSPDDPPRVPFPRSVSGDHTGLSSFDPNNSNNPSRLSRGRFSSEVEAGTRRKPRPNSFDELGAKPSRSRIESMISLGAASSNFSASDLRSSIDGSFVRKTLVVREDGKSPTHYQLGNCIGKGQFDAVYRALNLNTGQMVAVKRINLEGLSENDIKQLMREVDVVKSLSHPSIVKYEGMMRDIDTLNIVLEYAENGSMGQTLKAFGKLNEKLVASYVMKILEGLDYLHRNDVVHCDLKAANILTTKHGNVKLSDFGVSLNMRNVGREAKPDIAGTPNWMAPEVIELKGASPASDIWSLGCTVIELLTGRPPYADIPNGMSVMFHIVEDPVPPIPDDFSDLLKDFLRQCFRKDPSERPNAEQLCEHEWLRGHWAVHKELRPQDSIPFLRRVSADLQRSEAARSLAAIDVPSPETSVPEHGGSPGKSSVQEAPLISDSPRPALKRLSNGPGSPKFDTESLLSREHSFVKTSFSRSVMCRICMQPVRKHALVCEDCTLISHTACATNAPPTCGVRTQLLQYADSRENSPSPLGFLQQFSPPTSPGLEHIGSSPLGLTKSNSPTPESSPPPPTSFKMFGAFRRSKSSLSVNATQNVNRSSQGSGSSQDSAQRNVGTGAAGISSPQLGSNVPTALRGESRPRRPSLLVKPNHGHHTARSRPLSMSSDGNRSSLHSAVTMNDSEDMSNSSRDNSRNQSLNHHSPRGRTEVSFTNISPTEAESRPRLDRKRASHTQSISIVEPFNRNSILAPSTVGAEYGDEDADNIHGARGEPNRSNSRKRDAKSDKGCIVQ